MNRAATHPALLDKLIRVVLVLSLAGITALRSRSFTLPIAVRKSSTAT
jgi:hypothetical protein